MATKASQTVCVRFISAESVNSKKLSTYVTHKIFCRTFQEEKRKTKFILEASVQFSFKRTDLV